MRELVSSPFLSLDGRSAAAGRACGPLVRNRPDLAPDAASGGILVAERAVPDDVPRILSAAGTLTLGGALLSHVSLLSREFGRPSVSLRPELRPRLIDGDGSAAGPLLEVGAVVGGGRPVLHEGDVVLLDGDGGSVLVPGEFDRGRSSVIAAVWRSLSRFGLDPDDRALDLLIDTLRRTDDPPVEFVLEAGLRFRVVPAGDPSRRLLAGLERAGIARERSGPLLARMRAAVLAEADRKCAAMLREVGEVAQPDDLERRMAHATALEHRWRALVVDLGGDPEALDDGCARLRAAADDRRAALRAEVLDAVDHAIRLPDGAFRHRIGGLHRLVRRAVAADLPGDVVERLRARLRGHVAEARIRAGDRVAVALEPIDPPYDVGLVGGKAAGLFGAFPVLPARCRIAPGFVVTTVAYHLHLLGETEDRLREASRSRDEDVVIERRARAAILSAEIPDEVEATVRREVAALGDVPLAVRSSANVEDGPHGSLAGQFDTWLGVRGAEAVLDRLRWCWASLWNARALRTLAAAGRSPLDAAQAVLIQPVVRTRAAGVLISRDPSGRPDTLLVNATWGLGEGISQGGTPGDLYWVRRSDGEAIASDPSGSDFRLVLDPERPGTVEERLPPALAGRPCLDAGDLVRLAEVARALEGAAGRAQDVEFGFDENDDLVVFQVRRLVAAPPRDEDRGLG